MKESGIIGILGAMPEEINGILELMIVTSVVTIGMRDYHSGTIFNQSVVLVHSRWGKVAAATTATTLIQQFKVSKIIFTGVAGAINDSCSIADIVIGTRLIQYDMDARPIITQFEIPLLEQSYFHSDQQMNNLLEQELLELLKSNNLKTLLGEQKNRFTPKLHLGDIGSADRFIATHEQKIDLKKLIPSLLCVEMEGAALAQVCYEHRVPFSVIRIISDDANENSAIDFPLFIKEVASVYTKEIIRLFFCNSSS